MKFCLGATGCSLGCSHSQSYLALLNVTIADNSPASQLMHAVAWAEAYVPAGHWVQVGAFAEEEMLPPGHGVHCLLPSVEHGLVTYVPGEHALQGKQPMSCVPPQALVL